MGAYLAADLFEIQVHAALVFFSPPCIGTCELAEQPHFDLGRLSAKRHAQCTARAGHNQSSTQHDLSPWAHGAQVVYATGLAPMSTHYCHIQKQRMAVSGASVESICPEISCVLRIAQVEGVHIWQCRSQGARRYAPHTGVGAVGCNVAASTRNSSSSPAEPGDSDPLRRVATPIALDASRNARGT